MGSVALFCICLHQEQSKLQDLKAKDVYDMKMLGDIFNQNKLKKSNQSSSWDNFALDFKLIMNLSKEFRKNPVSTEAFNNWTDATRGDLSGIDLLLVN